MAPFTATDTSLRRSLEVSRLSSYFALVCCSQNGVRAVASNTLGGVARP
jgi:hypothetical protein